MSTSTQKTVPQNPINAAAAALIKRKAVRMVGRAGLRVQDREDLEQQLALHILERVDAYDPRRGSWSAFVHCLVDRHGENIIRSCRTAKRYAGPMGRLSDEIPAGDITNAARVRAVEAALANLPEHLRRVGELVMEGTVAAAARAMGFSRSTIYARLKELGERPEFRELEENPDGSSDSSRPLGVVSR